MKDEDRREFGKMNSRVETSLALSETALSRDLRRLHLAELAQLFSVPTRRIMKPPVLHLLSLGAVTLTVSNNFLQLSPLRLKQENESTHHLFELLI